MVNNQLNSKTSSVREIIPPAKFAENSTLVLFGEIFQRGYANGLVEEAQKAHLNIIYSTVGRREKDHTLRALSLEELQNAQKPIINIPLEAGFDLFPNSAGKLPVDQMKDLKLTDWKTLKMNFDELKESMQLANADFRKRVKEYVQQLQKEIHTTGDVVFAHIMAGGVPRAKVLMPIMNKVFKGVGDRYVSSEEFWQSDLGRFCSMNFDEVTAGTYQLLMDETASFRKEREAKGFKVSYLAYGYHGTEILIDEAYEWQTYSPYLQGWAKKKLEQISVQASQNGILSCVYNCPEILTNSSTIFQGVEVPLYSLVKAFQKEQPNDLAAKNMIAECRKRLKPEIDFNDIFKIISAFYQKPETKARLQIADWPTHSTKAQLEELLNHSDEIFNFHIDTKNLLTTILSEVIFKACGSIMLNNALEARQPVLWINHDIIAKMKVDPRS